VNDEPDHASAVRIGDEHHAEDEWQVQPGASCELDEDQDRGEQRRGDKPERGPASPVH
jgi:hypothetical protein